MAGHNLAGEKSPTESGSSGQKWQIKSAFSNKKEFKLWGYDLAEATSSEIRTRNPSLNPSLAGNSTRQPLASPAWQQPCCNKSWLSFDSKTLFSGGPRPIALTFGSSAPPCVVATQAAAADCSAMIHNVQGAGFILRETS
jgi:hypothetical protein